MCLVVFKVQTYCSALSCNEFMHITQDKNCFHIFHNTNEYRHKDDGGDVNDELLNSHSDLRVQTQFHNYW